MSLQNLLDIPREVFATSGVNTGNLIYTALIKSEGKLKAEYNQNTHDVTVLESSDLDPAILQKLLDAEPYDYQYRNWYPQVKKERDGVGNLQIQFSNTRILENSLSFPQEEFGPMGLQTIEIIQRSFAKYNRDAQANLAIVYNLARKKITVLNSLGVSSSDLNNILSKSPYYHQYDTWFPQVETNKDPEGNLEIDLLYNGINF